MKKIATLLIVMSMGSFLVAGECEELIAKYNAPNPETKTIKQLVRWAKRKVKDSNKKKILECLIARAADNPNKATVAGQ